MNIYRVRIKCIAEPPTGMRRKGESRKKVGYPMSYVDCLVEALDIDHAGEVGRRFVEDTASSEWRWRAFDLMEVARVQLPITI